MPDSSDPDAPRKESPRRRSLLHRIAGWSLRGLLAVMIVAAIVTQSGVLSWLILPQIERAVNCRAEAGRIWITPAGHLIINDLVLRVAGIDSEAARFLEVERVIVEPRWSGLWTWSLPVGRVTAVTPTLRLSHDDRFQANIASLGGRGRSTNVTFIPGIEVTDATIEFGQHGPGVYTKLFELKMAGQVRAANATSTKYRVELDEIPATGRADASPMAAAPGAPLQLRGEIDLARSEGSVVLANLDLDDWRGKFVPSTVADFWERMDVRGGVHDASFTYTPQEGPLVRLRLADVSMNIPVPPESEDVLRRTEPMAMARPEEQLLAMRSVSGELRFGARGARAVVRGILEDLPCAVELETEGYGLASGLRVSIKTEQFLVADRPKLLPFAPFFVKRNFKRFSGPTAVMSGEVEVRRDAPVDGKPQPVRASGRIEFARGEASFEKFPYPFSNMSGTIVFDDKEVRILKITGVGPTGASLLATGRIAPPDDGAVVEIDIVVTDVPTDRELRAALPERRRSLVDMLMSPDKMEELRAAGLIGASAGGASEAPPFALGGPLTIRVRIRRSSEADGFTSQIEVAGSDVGLLSRVFPYPVVASDFRMQIDERSAQITASGLKGLTGAEADLRADVVLGEPGSPHQYDVRVSAGNAPVDGLLLTALPAGAEPGELSSRSLLERLSMAGRFGCEARVFSREESELGYDICVDLAGLEAHPGGPGCLSLPGLSGHLVITHDDVHAVRLQGGLGAGEFAADLIAARGPGGTFAHIDTSVVFREAPLEAPVEALVKIVAPTVGDRLAGLRAGYVPAGIVTGSLELSTGEGLPTDYALRIDRVDDASLRVAGTTISLGGTDGAIIVTPALVSVAGARASLWSGGVDSGSLRADGTWPLRPGHDGRLSLSVTAARFESPLVRGFVSAVAPGSAAQAVGDIDPRGAFDLHGSLRADVAGTPSFEGILEPRSLAIVRNGSLIQFDTVQGRIVFASRGNEVESFRAEAPGWGLWASGGWTTRPELSVDLRVGLRSEGLPDSLTAALPERVRSALAELELKLTGPVVVDEGRLMTVPGTSAREADADDLVLTARVAFQDAALEAGLPIRAGPGELALDVRWPMASVAEAPRISSVVTASTLRAGGINMQSARADLRALGKGEGVEIAQLAASVHGGSLSGWGVVERTTALGSAPRSYQGQLQLAGVDFAAVVDDLRTALPPSNGSDAAASAASPGLAELQASPASAPTGARGVLDATLSIEGLVGSAEGRRGRGLIRIAGGEVISLPGLMPLLRLSNLQPPLNERLESASASFFIEGDRVSFERLEASSQSLLIVGAGTARWSDGGLDLRFTTQGRSQIPIISDMLQGLRDELATAAVGGTISRPEYRVESLQGTQRMLDTIFRGRDSARDRGVRPAADQDQP
ncbi:MAG: hypothetical protein SFZ24_06915 [Planctomycetota bacterium]|nr:hypothetical protein [Planctomycetota bacterium]